ncbi:MAG TPA: hypothetical protein VF928_01030 [Usitatibacteraceae bacterium]
MKTFIRSTLRVSAISAVMLMANAAMAQGVAFITDIRGDATLGAGKAALMAEVGKGARIACMKECQVGIMYLVSGKEFTLKGPGDFAVGEVEVTAKIGPPPTVRETAWKVSSQTVSQAVQTSNASIRMRSVGATATAKGEEKPAMERLLYPVQTNVVSLQPVFRWTADSPRGPFDFELKSVGATAKTIYKAKAGDTMVKLPSSVKLQPESEYAWTVKMADKVAGKEIGSGSFKTLPVASRELVQQRKPADKAEFSDWLLYGLTLRELGATQDAAEVFGKLARERADSPELAALAK